MKDLAPYIVGEGDVFEPYHARTVREGQGAGFIGDLFVDLKKVEHRLHIGE